jgi:hypothetical protein
MYNYIIQRGIMEHSDLFAVDIDTATHKELQDVVKHIQEKCGERNPRISDSCKGCGTYK